MQEMQVQSLGWKDPLEEGMTTHSSILALKIPIAEKPDGVAKSMGLQGVRQNWTTKHNTAQMEAYNVHYKNQGEGLLWQVC